VRFIVCFIHYVRNPVEVWNREDVCFRLKVHFIDDINYTLFRRVRNFRRCRAYQQYQLKVLDRQYFHAFKCSRECSFLVDWGRVVVNCVALFPFSFCAWPVRWNKYYFSHKVWILPYNNYSNCYIYL
jgi:hypothetical protein